MADDKNDLDELQAQMERVVGAGPAATLMRHLSPVEWPEVATKADINALAGATKADISALAEATKADNQRLRDQISNLDKQVEVGLLALNVTLIEKINQQTLTMIFALVAVVAAMSSVALFR